MKLNDKRCLRELRWRYYTNRPIGFRPKEINCYSKLAKKEINIQPLYLSYRHLNDCQLTISYENARDQNAAGDAAYSQYAE
jgi:hypothetical protein